MESRIKEKIEEIQQYLNELESIKPDSLKEYLNDLKEKAACERYVEKIMEAVTDLSFLLIKKYDFEKPDDDQSAFKILADNDIITSKVLEKLRNAKGMKNIISHQYGTIDDEIVFEAITQELIKDVREFLKEVGKKIHIY